MMDLSIVIPFYKGASYINKCIQSIINAYAWSRQLIRYELIVVVDSPDEDSIIFMERMKTQYIDAMSLKIYVNDCNRGVAWSRNYGLSQSKCTFVTFIDQDDWMNFNYFSVLEKQLDNRYDCLLLNGYWYFSERKKYKQVHFVKPDFSFEAILRQRYPAPTPGLVIFNRQRLLSDNLFPDISDEYKGCDDWAAYLQLSLERKSLKCCYVATPIFIICKHNSNYSSSLMHMFLCDFAVLEHFRKLLPEGKRKRLMDTIIKLKYFRIDRDVYRMTRKELIKKHGLAVYCQYLYNKRIFWRYIGWWINKKRFALFGRIDIRD